MEKDKIVTQIIKKTIRTYYCDGCGKELDTVEEYEDGGMPSSRYEVKTSCRFNNDWYGFNKCLCQECKNNFITDFEKAMEQLGFCAEKQYYSISS